MSCKRHSSLWAMALLFWQGHVRVWQARVEYFRREGVLDVLEIALSLFTFCVGVSLATVRLHPTEMDNIIAVRLDARLSAPPGLAEAHHVFGAGMMLLGVVWLTSVMEWPSPDAGGKLPSGTPPRLLVALMWLRSVGTVSAATFWGYSFALCMPNSHTVAALVSGCLTVACFGLHLRANKRYAQDKAALRRASVQLGLTDDSPVAKKDALRAA